MTRKVIIAIVVLVASVMFKPSPIAADQAPPAHRVKAVEIKILSTMLADDGFGEWGFAALVQVDGRRILFDTGANEDTVARNLKVLGLSLADVDTVILSHNHADHTTGLVTLRRQFASTSPSALRTAYVGKGIFWPRIATNGTVSDRMNAVRKDYEAIGGRVIEVEKPTEIMPGVWLTGPVPRVHPERNWSPTGKVRSDKGDVEDTIPEDMAMIFQTEKGVVELFGCGHAGVINTLTHVRATIDPSPVRAIIGGLHLFDASDAHLQWTATQLKAFGVKELVGAHCTGIEAVYRIRQLAELTRQTCMVGAVGASYSLDKGISPGRVAK